MLWDTEIKPDMDTTLIIVCREEIYMTNVHKQGKYAVLSELSGRGDEIVIRGHGCTSILALPSWLLTF